MANLFLIVSAINKYLWNCDLILNSVNFQKKNLRYEIEVINFNLTLIEVNLDMIIIYYFYIEYLMIIDSNLILVK